MINFLIDPLGFQNREFVVELERRDNFNVIALSDYIPNGDLAQYDDVDWRGNQETKKLQEAIRSVNGTTFFKGCCENVNAVHFPIYINDFLFYNDDYFYDFTYWMNKGLAEVALNKDYAVVSAKELKRQIWLYYKTFSVDTKIFVRPDHGYKAFTGCLVDLQDFDQWYVNSITEENENYQVIVSTPKKIRGEWRFVCYKRRQGESGEILARSCYMFDGNITEVPHAPPGAEGLVLECIKSYDAYQDEGGGAFFVMDICQDYEGNFHFLEINSLECSGLYACNPDKILDKIEEGYKVDSD